MNYFAKFVCMTIDMSASGRQEVRKCYSALNGVPTELICHPIYDVVAPWTSTSKKAKELLGIDTEATVILFFGSIRPYKNVPGLINAFVALTDSHYRLVICGQPLNTTIRTEIDCIANSDQRIMIRMEVIPEESISVYMAAAALVVAPYHDILNSGTAILALGHGIPILVPNRGAMGELAEIVGADWVRQFTPPLCTKALAEAVQWATSCPRICAPDLSAFSVDGFVGSHDRAFTSLLKIPFQNDQSEVGL